jgi:outer membrane protein assembly factor BamD
MKFQIHAAYLILFLLLSGCTSKSPSELSAETLFQEAEEEFKDGRYLIAIEKFRDIKNRFPYSSKAVDSELRIADAYFEQESYIESETAYDIFKELHPTHAKADYVQFRIGLSNFLQIPSHPGRDLTAAYKAIDSFRLLEEKFPSSEYVEKARIHTGAARQKIAEYESYVADFYFRRKHFLSASYRYAALLKDFPDMGYDEEALYRLGESYFRIRMFTNAKDALDRLLGKFPDTSYKSRVYAFLNEMKKN